MRYKVTKYTFREPQPIGKAEYEEIKRQQKENQNFSLLAFEDPLAKNFQRVYKFFAVAGISAVVFIILFLIEDIAKENIVLTIIFALVGLFTFIGIMVFMMSLTDLITYAEYIKKKKVYFQKMESSVGRSANYLEFYMDFYK